MDAQIALIAGLIIVIASIIGIIGLVIRTLNVSKKQVLITSFCVLGFLLIQLQATLITAHYDDIARAKRYVTYAQEWVSETKTALEECKKEHAQHPQHHPDENPCWREQIRVVTASSSLSEYEAALKYTEVLSLSLFFGFPFTGIIGILIVIGSIVLTIIFKRRKSV